VAPPECGLAGASVRWSIGVHDERALGYVGRQPTQRLRAGLGSDEFHVIGVRDRVRWCPDGNGRHAGASRPDLRRTITYSCFSGRRSGVWPANSGELVRANLIADLHSIFVAAMVPTVMLSRACLTCPCLTSYIVVSGQLTASPHREARCGAKLACSPSHTVTSASTRSVRISVFQLASTMRSQQQGPGRRSGRRLSRPCVGFLWPPAIGSAR